MQNKNAGQRIIYLFRHCRIETEDNERRYLGQLDLPLSAEGVRQAHCLQKKMAEKKFSAIFCSDLKRSYNTAQIMAAGLNKLIVVPEFREISLGEWEGKSFAKIKRDFPAEYLARGNNLADYQIPGGESFKDCQLRVTGAFLKALDSTAGDIVIVGHAGVNRALICGFLGMPLENLFLVSQDYGCLNILLHTKSHCLIKTINVNLS